MHVVRIARQPAERVAPRVPVTRPVRDKKADHRAQNKRCDEVAEGPAAFRPLRASLHLLSRSLLVPGVLAHLVLHGYA